MSAISQPATVQRIEEAEEKIVHSAEVASQVTEELCKFGAADFDTVSQLAEEFLIVVKDAQAILQDVIKRLPPATPFQGRTYIQRLQASAAAAAAAAAEADSVASAGSPAPGAAQGEPDAAEAMDMSTEAAAGGAAAE